MQLLSKKDIEETNLLKCFELVANAGNESEDIQELLRPASSKKEASKDSGKGGKKKMDEKSNRKTTILAQYPLRPPSGNRGKTSSSNKRTAKK